MYFGQRMRETCEHSTIIVSKLLIVFFNSKKFCSGRTDIIIKRRADDCVGSCRCGVYCLDNTLDNCGGRTLIKRPSDSINYILTRARIASSGQYKTLSDNQEHKQ